MFVWQTPVCSFFSVSLNDMQLHVNITCFGLLPQLKSLESGKEKTHPSEKHQLWRYQNIPLLTVAPNLMASAETVMKDVPDFYNQNNQRGLFNLTKQDNCGLTRGMWWDMVVSIISQPVVQCVAKLSEGSDAPNGRTVESYRIWQKRHLYAVTSLFSYN